MADISLYSNMIDSKQSSLASDIPVELVKYIIDYLHDNTAALCSSSLVCRTWTDPARYHLFDELKIHSNKKEYASGVLFLGLRDIVQSGHAIHSYIKRLTLQADPAMNQLLPADLLQMCHDSFPSLHTLFIKGLRFPFPRVGQSDNGNMVPRVHTLQVQDSVLDDGFLSTLGCLDSLRNLVLENMRRYTTELSTSFCRPHLTYLHFGNANDAPTLRYFLTPDLAPHLKSLSLQSNLLPSLEVVEYIKSFLHHPDAKLNHLSIYPKFIKPLDSFSEASLFEIWKLQSLPSLTSFRVVFPLSGLFYDDHSTIRWSPILPNLLPPPHPNIRHLEFGLQLLWAETLGQLTERMRSWDWGTLRTTLSRWTALETITFNHMEVNGNEWAKEWEEMVRCGLEGLPAVRIVFRYNTE